MSNILEMTKEALKSEIRAAALNAGIVSEEQLPEFVLEVPKEKSHGDFSTNIAMQLTRIAKQNPRAIADAIIAGMDLTRAAVSKVEVAGPGFINFTLDRSFLVNVIPQVIEAGSQFGRINLGKGERVQVEFVSANPTGSLHLGHARNAAFGDALCKVLDYAGYDVAREYYINDAGNQINNLSLSLEARYFQALGQDVAMPEDGYHGEDIKGFAQQLVDAEGERLVAMSSEERLAFLRAFGLEKELDKIKRDLGRFRVSFDNWFSETSIYERGMTDKVLTELRDLGHVYDEEGAVWLNTVPFGDDKNRVLVKNDGSFTYLTPDIAYHRDKFERGFDRLINIWGADHHGYIPRMKAAMQAFGYDPARLTVLVTQMVSLFQGGEKVKMSKRTGKAVTMEDLMDEVGVDPIRYFFTMRSPDSHLDFDMDLAVSKSNENPVFYVQYAHARICSVFRQAEEQGISLLPLNEVRLEALNKSAEYDLLQRLAELEEEVRIAAEQYAPHRLIRYVYELASQFHSYYKAERVIGEDANLLQARLYLLSAVRTTIANVLQLVGVSAPERM